jgi:hypothetical protein
VQHHRELAQLDVEQPLEPPARVLELRQDALDVGRVAVVVTGDERLGCGLEPGNASSVAEERRPRPGGRGRPSIATAAR